MKKTASIRTQPGVKTAITFWEGGMAKFTKTENTKLLT